MKEIKYRMYNKPRILSVKPDVCIVLPPVFKRKWLQALRSDEYAQATNYLASPNEGFCCLGVAANICEIGVNNLFDAGTLSDLEPKFHRRLPKAFLTREGCKVQSQLAEFNDCGYSFKQIAQWIEKYL